MTREEALEAIGVEPDCIIHDRPGNLSRSYFHIRTDDGSDIYFLANIGAAPTPMLASFRVARRAPEIWLPDSGEIRRPALYRYEDGRVTLPLTLGPDESLFVVFRGDDTPPPVTRLTRNGETLFDADTLEPVDGAPEMHMDGDRVVIEGGTPGDYALTRGNGKTVRYVAAPAAPLPVTGPWSLSFDGPSAPDSFTLDALRPLNEDERDRVRHFSGHITYTTTINVPEDFPAEGRALHLDLGEVRELATVRLNGEDLGVWWKPPYRKEVTGVLRPGKNTLEVTAVNTWVNRLIGDANLPEAERVTSTPAHQFYKGTEALPPSGLLGPVRLEATSVAASE
jgi:hypothetical protein